jgi:nucleotide-binding universal stress UspA family protein
MFKHLLLPLDGSQLAEAALPVTAYLAQRLQAQVTLLHVIERNAPPAVHGDRHLTDAAQATAYLREVAQTLPATSVVDFHTHTDQVNDVARSIVVHAQELAIDLIVMCTHGRGGLHRMLFGSIAQKVVAQGDTPTLLIPPAMHQPVPFTLRTLLVPLDGNPDHEHSLALAGQLASACAAHLHLVQVVPWPTQLSGQRSAVARLLPSTAAALQDLAEQQAVEYLQTHVQRLIAAGVPTTATVHRGDPAAALVDSAVAVNADLIVLATHGKTHADAFWSGSVTPKVLGQAHLPILLAPVSTIASAA